MTRYLKSKWFLYFLLIPFFKPICFQYYASLSFLETLFVAWKMVSAIFSGCLLALYAWNQGKMPKLIIGVFLFELSIVLSTLINHGYLSRALIDAISITTYVSVLCLAIKYNQAGLIYVLRTILVVLVVINFATILFFPEGLSADLYTNKGNPLYFMVVDNGSALFLIFSILLFYLDGFNRNGRIVGLNKLCMAVCLFSALFSKSATAIFSVMLLMVSIVLVEKSNLAELTKPKILLLIYLLGFGYLMSMQENALLQYILVHIFDRSTTFTGRYVLWEAALKMIELHPWIGYGKLERDYLLVWGGAASSHNLILEILLQGGLVALMLFVGIIIATARRINSKPLRKVTACLILTLLVVLIAALMESTVHSVYIFGTICFCYYGRLLEKKEP